MGARRSLLKQPAVAADHPNDRPTPNPPLVRTMLCEPDSSGRSWSSPPIHDGRASGGRKNRVANPRRVFRQRTSSNSSWSFAFRFARERNNGVQMIRHKQTKAAMPDKSFVVEFHGGDQGIASFCAAELVLARRHAVDGDKELTSLGHPLRNGVR
jgi:hypothetical protein